MHHTTNESYMSLALALAEHGRGTTSPNPMVGALIIKDGRIIGQGFHLQAGGPHAEIHALKEAGASAQGATLVVTLEPCCHHGRTPPCTNAIIEAGITHVIIGAQDPNPLVAGKGIETLKAAGITVTTGVLAKTAEALNVAFNHYITTKTPYITAKWAMSLDGKTIARPEDHRQLTETTALAHAHVKRSHIDAILIGANTAKADNPQLTARDPETNEPKANQPLRFILSANGDLPLTLQLLNAPLAENTWVITTEASTHPWRDACLAQGVNLLITKSNSDNNIDLHDLMTHLGKMEITHLLVEGGMSTLHNFFDAGLVNAIDVYLAPVIIGNLPQKKLIHIQTPEVLGRDLLITGEWHV